MCVVCDLVSRQLVDERFLVGQLLQLRVYGTRGFQYLFEVRLAPHSLESKAHRLQRRGDAHFALISAARTPRWSCGCSLSVSVSLALSLSLSLSSLSAARLPCCVS